MSTNNKTLFSEFAPVSKEQWMERVNVDLKGADFDKKLVWKNLSGINIQPCYNFENKITQLKNTGENSQSLVNYRSIVVATAESGNKLALKAVEEGMNGIIFEINENISVEILLNGLDLNTTTVSFEVVADAIDFTEKLVTYAKGSDLKGYLNTAIMSNYVTTGSFDENQIEVAVKLVALTENFPNFKAITVSGTEYLDSGANQVQEIAYTLNSLVYYQFHFVLLEFFLGL